MFDIYHGLIFIGRGLEECFFQIFGHHLFQSGEKTAVSRCGQVYFNDEQLLKSRE